MKASWVDKFSKSDIIVLPSILSANFSKLGEHVLFYIFNFVISIELDENSVSVSV